jgi:hypothetical protein
MEGHGRVFHTYRSRTVKYNFTPNFIFTGKSKRLRFWLKTTALKRWRILDSVGANLHHLSSRATGSGASSRSHKESAISWRRVNTKTTCTVVAVRALLHLLCFSLSPVLSLSMAVALLT